MASGKRFLYLPVEKVSLSLIFDHPRVIADPVSCRQSLCSSTDEADERVSHVLAQAIVLFEGDAGAAIKWMGEPNRALVWQRPLELMATEEGVIEVLL